jgi:hypothetical protein
MNTINTSIYIANALLLSIGAASAYAVPEQTKPTVAGVLTGPMVQVPLKDPLIKKAVEILKKNIPAQPQDSKPKKQNKPDSPIGRRILILGGPEVVPM